MKKKKSTKNDKENKLNNGLMLLVVLVEDGIYIKCLCPSILFRKKLKMNEISEGRYKLFFEK